MTNCKFCNDHGSIVVPVFDDHFGEQFTVRACPHCTATMGHVAGMWMLAALAAVLGLVVWVSFQQPS